ncbi:hypothetical protein [Streptomyces caatingaensis]|uniref:GHMP kinase N-terminal domain-containing protein n=1 Tax=Streptomyces caatingaensis TaxID=1678637 RepID=A0A0K9XFR8_9ACTN|nr:hypothetical protein [Streptomyces caatingaensis]KNB52254.1 hypothetical protein AC230_11945 [Streptomyces caatingaensis]
MGVLEVQSERQRTKSFCGVSHGTLGELFQGPLWRAAEPQIAIVSLPVAKYSWSHFVHDPEQPAGVQLGLAGRSKSARAVRHFLELTGREPLPGRWEFFSELEVGKGMASSTADIVATLRCLFNAHGIPYDQRIVTDVLRGIERADSVFLDEFALYLSGRHEVVRRFGSDVGFSTCYVTEDGAVDTEDLEPALLGHYRRHSTAYADCLDDLVKVFSAGDAPGIARCSSRSAALSQQVVPKESYEELLKHQDEFGADGIFVAHTGTIIGYLFHTRPDRFAMDELSSFFHGLGRQCHFAKGGWGHV